MNARLFRASNLFSLNEFNKFNNAGARMKDSIYCIVSYIYDTKIASY